MSPFLKIPFLHMPFSSMTPYPMAIPFKFPFCLLFKVPFPLCSLSAMALLLNVSFLPWPFPATSPFFSVPFPPCSFLNVPFPHCPLSSMSPFLNVSFLQCLLCSIFLFLNVPFQSTALALYYLILLRYLTKPLWTDIAPTNICTGNISLLFTVLFVV